MDLFKFHFIFNHISNNAPKFKLIKNEFEMTIDIVGLISEVDEDSSGEIEFDEFKALLQSSAGIEDPTEKESGAEKTEWAKKLWKITQSDIWLLLKN